MRLLSNPNGNAANGHSETPVRFTTVVGQVYRVALKYPTGKVYPSRRPGFPDSVLYTLSDGRCAWFAPEVARLIDDLRLAPGEPFTVCNLGSRRGWQILRVPPTQDATPEVLPPFTPTETRASAVSAPASTPAVVMPAPVATKLEGALRTAIQAAANAEKYGQSIGYPVRFDSESIRAMAITVLINSSEGGRR